MASTTMSSTMRALARNVSNVTSRRSMSSYPAYVTGSSVSSETTSSGAKVATESLPGDVTSVSVKFDMGSRDESSASSGSGNLLKDVAFKGYESEINKLGGHFSATVSKEFTTFSATVANADVKAATELLGAIVTKPKFTDADVDSAKSAVLEELKYKKIKRHDTLLFEQLNFTAFLDTPLGQWTTGTSESVEGLSTADVKAYLSSAATSGRTAVGGSGSVDGLKGLVDAWGLPAGSAAPVDMDAPTLFTGSDIRVRFDSYPLGHVAIGYESLPYTDSKQIELLLLKELIGSWSASSGVGSNGWTKMAQVLGENNYAKEFSAFNFGYKDTGLFGVYFTATDNNLEQTMWWTMDSLVSLCHKLEDDDVEIAKANLKAAYLASKSSTALSADVLATEMSTIGKTMSTAEFFTRVDACDAKSCMAVAQEVIKDEDHALAAVGPLTELPDYTWIRRRSYWLRY